MKTIAILQSLRDRLAMSRDGIDPHQAIEGVAYHSKGLRAGLDIAVQAIEWEIHTARIMAGEQPQQGN